MIFKLAWRNACRSAGDYFVYVMTVIILAALLCVAHCVAAVGQRQAGFSDSFAAAVDRGDSGTSGRRAEPVHRGAAGSGAGGLPFNGMEKSRLICAVSSGTLRHRHRLLQHWHLFWAAARLQFFFRN